MFNAIPFGKIKWKRIVAPHQKARKIYMQRKVGPILYWCNQPMDTDSLSDEIPWHNP
jgi:hypothetical protein